MKLLINNMPLLDRYILARWCYSIGEDFIGDIEYNELHNKLKEEIPDNEYVCRSWSDDPCPMDLLKKYDLGHLFRDIKFVHKSESIRSINNDDEFERIFRTLDEPSRLSFKLDGFNIQVNYFNGKPISAETRGRKGNSVNAGNILSIVPQNIPMMGMVKVTGELVVRNSKWEELKRETGNTSQRNSVATALANNATEYVAFVAFNIQSDKNQIDEDLYNVLNRYGFKVPMYMTVKNYAELKREIRELAIYSKVCDYPTDGLVIENTNYQLALRVGAWQEEMLQSYVIGYDENVGLHSNAMLVNIRPITNDGRTLKQVSVTNLSYILACDLEVGSPIAFDNRAMATAVLNVSRTADLHKQYEGRYEDYRKMIDRKEGDE